MYLTMGFTIMETKYCIEVPNDKGFFFVPGFSKYSINTIGVLKRVSSGRVMSWCVFKGGGKKNITGGYRVTNIYNDANKRQGVSRHRLLCMVFKPCDGDWVDYTVNHIDGVPGNDVLSNLEWATRAQNNQHAYDTGLRSSVGVIVKNWVTNETTHYPSIAKCADAHCVSHAAICSRLTNSPRLAYEDGLQMKRADDTLQWVDPSERMCKVRKSLICLMTNTNTNVTELMPSAAAVSRVLGVSEQTIINRLYLNSTEPLNGYTFSLVGGAAITSSYRLTGYGPADM